MSVSHRTKLVCVEFSFVEAHLLSKSERLEDLNFSFEAPPWFRLCERTVLAEIWFCRNHSPIDKSTYPRNREHLTNLRA